MAKKNLQFLFNLHETWPKLLSRWLIILPKFRGDWIKIVDFLLTDIRAGWVMPGVANPPLKFFFLN